MVETAFPSPEFQKLKQMPAGRRRSQRSERGHALAELDGEAPRVAHHEERVAAGGVFDEECRARFFEAFAVGFCVGRDKGDVQHERVHLRIFGHERGGVAVNFNKDAAGFVGEEVREGRGVHAAGYGEAEVLNPPCGLGAGVGGVEGEVFEFHVVWILVLVVVVVKKWVIFARTDSPPSSRM